MTMHRNLFKLTILAVAVAASLPAMADSTATMTTSTKHNYTYYRDHEIYYGPETKTYYWKVDGKWQAGTVLPSAHQAYVKTGGVTVELDTEVPYERHDYVLSRYNDGTPDGGTTTTEKTVAMNADGSSTTTTTTTKQNYVYYGDHEIYYAPERKTYYWKADGKWQSGPELPMASRSFITSGGVTIELDTNRPYTRHEYVLANHKHKHDRKND